MFASIFDQHGKYTELNENYKKLSESEQGFFDLRNIQQFYDENFIDSKLMIISSRLSYNREISTLDKKITIFIKYFNEYCKLYDKYIDTPNYYSWKLINPISFKNKDMSILKDFYYQYDILIINIINDKISIDKVNVTQIIKNDLIMGIRIIDKKIIEIMSNIIYEQYLIEYKSSYMSIESYIYDKNGIKNILNNLEFIELTIQRLNNKNIIKVDIHKKQKIMTKENKQLLLTFINNFINKFTTDIFKLYINEFDLKKNIIISIFDYIYNEFFICKTYKNVYSFMFYLMYEDILNSSGNIIKILLLISFYSYLYNKVITLLNKNDMIHFHIPFLKELKYIHIIKAIHNNNSLKILNLSSMDGKSLTSTDIENIFTGLKKNNIEQLYLCNNNIDNCVLEHICKFIKNNKKLKIIDLSYNNIDNKGCMELFKSLNNTNITTLILTNNYITPDIYKHYIKYLGNNKNIKSIKLIKYSERILDINIQRGSIYFKVFWNLIKKLNKNSNSFVKSWYSHLEETEQNIKEHISSKLKKRKKKLLEHF